MSECQEALCILFLSGWFHISCNSDRVEPFICVIRSEMEKEDDIKPNKFCLWVTDLPYIVPGMYEIFLKHFYPKATVPILIFQVLDVANNPNVDTHSNI